MSKSFVVWTVIPSSPAVPLLFSQLRGDIAPIRTVQDPYLVFADDPESNLAAVADENKFSLRPYDRDLNSGEVADPRTVVTGVKSGIDFICGVAVDPLNKQIYTANNDMAADLMVVLTSVATGTWGIGLDLVHDEVAVTIQDVNKVAMYRRLASAKKSRFERIVR